jgi:hypothetical protein
MLALLRHQVGWILNVNNRRQILCLRNVKAAQNERRQQEQPSLHHETLPLARFKKEQG